MIILSKILILFAIALSVLLSSCSSGNRSSMNGYKPNPLWCSTSGEDKYGYWAELKIGGVVQRFRFVNSGSFIMGCDDRESDKEWEEFEKKYGKIPRDGFVAKMHHVTLKKGFWMADSECTQALWVQVMGANPSTFSGDPQLPVDNVSWNDCVTMLKKLNASEVNLFCRLPTEAEWEYACRAGISGDFPDRAIADASWYEDNSDQKTHVVKLKAPNAWGLYDMIGNVREWCSDKFGEYPLTDTVDPVGPDAGRNRVFRGGAWMDSATDCQPSRRGGTLQFVHSTVIGFRICISAQRK